MAVTVTLQRTKTGHIPTNGGMIPITITVTSGTTYATASGGFTIDLTSVLQEINSQNGGITIEDVLGVYAGVDNAGYISGGFAKATGNNVTLRHWLNNGTITERADGNSWTSTMHALLRIAHA